MRSSYWDSYLGDPSGDFFTANIRTRKFDVLELRRDPDIEFLHALVHETVTDGRAAAHHAVADGHEVENVGDDTGGQFFAGNGELPVRLFGGVGQNFIPPPRQPVCRNFAETVQLGRSQPDAGRGAGADLRGLLRRDGHAQRLHADPVGKRFERLLQLHGQPALTQHPAGEAHLQPAVAHLPVIDTVSAHVRHVESGLGRQLECVNAGLFDIQCQAVYHHLPRLFEPHVDAVGHGNDRFDRFKLERQGEGTGVETVGGHGIVRRIDLAQPGERPDFNQHVLGGNGQRAGFAVHV